MSSISGAPFHITPALHELFAGTHGINANQFVGNDKPPVGKTLLLQIPVVMDGTEWNQRETVGCDIFKIYTDDAKSIYLQINSSPLKNVYRINQQESPDVFFTYVEHFGGYKNAEYRANILELLDRKFVALKISPPQVPWYRFSH